MLKPIELDGYEIYQLARYFAVADIQNHRMLKIFTDKTEAIAWANAHPINPANMPNHHLH